MTYTKDSIVFEPLPTHSRYIDLTNQSFNRLTVLGFAGTTHQFGRRWWCECECGTITCVTTGSLRGKKVGSCGCTIRTHGLAGKTPEYTAWANMKARCSNTNRPDFPYYGGRGITVCDRWLNSFENFYADMGDRPSPKHSVERRDNKLNYTPDNSYWADKIRQANNRRNNHLLTLNGVSKTMAEWSKELHISYTALRRRVNSLGWSDERALTTPVS